MDLFVSDLDGTLLNDQSQLDGAAIDKLNRMIAEGLNFTIATARAYASIMTILDGLDLKLPIIEQNGALLRDFSTGRVLTANFLSLKEIADTCDVFREFNADPIASVYEGQENYVLLGRTANPGMTWAYDNMVNVKSARRMASYKCVDELKRPSVILMRYLGPEAEIRKIGNAILALQPKLSVTRFHNFYTGGWEINISSAEANKGKALNHLRQHSGTVNKLIVFGDSDNDMDMFTHADEAYAVANATPAIRSLALTTIGPNSENAVVRFIEQRMAEALV